MLLLARSAAITKKPYRSTCNKNNVSLQLKARVNANMRLVGYEVIITNSRYALVGYYITSYPTRASAHGIIVIDYELMGRDNLLHQLLASSCKRHVIYEWVWFNFARKLV